MDRIQIIAAGYGLLTGLAFIPAYEGAHRGVLRIWNPLGSSMLRVLSVMLLATLVACVVVGVLIFVPGYLIGIVPLRENAPYFGWAFATGGLACRAFIEFRKRRKETFE